MGVEFDEDVHIRADINTEVNKLGRPLIPLTGRADVTVVYAEQAHGPCFTFFTFPYYRTPERSTRRRPSF